MSSVDHFFKINFQAYSAPLIHASAVGNKRMVETLLLYGANINKQDQVWI
jgi:hypothetical protein